MEIRLVESPVALAEIAALAKAQFGDFVKAVVDVERSVMAVGGELHSDAESLLLGDGSAQEDLWGINLYPEQMPGAEGVEFDSLINVRPLAGNRSRGVEDEALRGRILEIVRSLAGGAAP